jgi:hypothetical protein
MEECVMRQFARLATMVTVLSLSLLSGSWFQSSVQAQESTPPAEGEDMVEGVTFELLGLESGVSVPSPADLIAVRISIGPGAALPLEESDPTGGMLLVESGAPTIVIGDAWRITRAAGLTDRLAAAETTGDFASISEEIAADAETTLDVGDVAYVPGGVTGEIRNAGGEPAVMYVILLSPTMMGGMEGTPAP